MVQTPLGVVVPIKQVPLTNSDERLADNGRLLRHPDATEINPWCRRAITAGIRLASQLSVPCTVISVGPPAVERALLEAAAAGAHATIQVTDPALAGSDALATAQVLAAVISSQGGAAAVVAGHESIDGATGVVPAMLAELLGMSFMGPYLEVGTPTKHSDRVWFHGVVQGSASSTAAAVRLPAVVTVAERSGPPAKVPWDVAQYAGQPRRLTVADLPGLGEAIGEHSRTHVDAVAAPPALQRRAQVLPYGRLAERALLKAFFSPATARADAPDEALDNKEAHCTSPQLVLTRREDEGAVSLVALARRLTSGTITLVTTDQDALGSGADEVVLLGCRDPAPVATALADLLRDRDYHGGVIAAADLWERHVLGRLAVRLDAGLLTDLTALTTALSDPAKWLGEKTVGSGYLATVSSRSNVQLATVRTAFLPSAEPTRRSAAKHRLIPLPGEEGVCGDIPDIGTLGTELTSAEVVIGIGRGVDAADLPLAERLARHIGAELAATRPVTDAGLLPHGRQVGITGTSIAPRVYLGLGISGNARHLNGLAGVGTLLGVTLDAAAPLAQHADLTVVGDWRVVARALLATKIADLPSTHPNITPVTYAR